MLPLLQLPLLEPGVPGAANAAENLLPDGATDLDGAFAAILSTRLAPEAATGSAMPLTGNALPLLTPPDPELPVSTDLPLAGADIEVAAGWSDYELPIAASDGPRLPLPEPAAIEAAGTPVRAPLETLIQPDAAIEGEPALRTLPAAPAVGAVARTVTRASGDVTDRSVEVAVTAQRAAPTDVDTVAERGVRAPAATNVAQPVTEPGTHAGRNVVEAPPVRAPESTLPQRAPETLDARPPAVVDTDGSRQIAPAGAASDGLRVARDDAPALTRPSPVTVSQPNHVAVDTTQPIADVAARPAAEAHVSAPRVAAPPPTLLTTLDVPVQDPRWEQALSERILVLAGGRAHNAEIRLTPAELGPLRVQITIDDGTANVAFQARHAVTREALEQALPRLREMLSDSGLTLGQASVGEQGVAREGREDVRGAANALDADRDQSDAEQHALELGPTSPRRGDALIDTFA